MAEYIEREAAIYAVLGITICNPMVRQYADAVLFNLNKLPAADVAPVRRGRWLGGEYDGYADGAPVFDTLICSQCGAEYDADIADTANYCPNCGADMRGGS